MLPFLLKSTACLAIFLVFYKLVLENESMHHFKRFYLLGALLASIIIPNMVFVEYVDMAQNDAVTTSISDFNNTITPLAEPLTEAAEMEWREILWSIYFLGVLVFAFRFFKNLGQIWLRIRQNPRFKDHFITRVLLAQQLPPHTFFNFVFLNKNQFEAQKIPEDVILHEETHAKQKHSLDILLIELAQVVFWFNPLIYLLKSYIKLNHEFLADREVVNRHRNPSAYQNTLLSYLSHDSFGTYQSTGIANAINYSSIKKRFTVMKTNTSRKSIVWRSLLVLPLTALLLSGFAEKRQIEIDNSADQIIGLERNVSPSDMKIYNQLAKKYNAIPIAKRVIPLKDLKVLENLYRSMNETQKENAAPFPECLPTNKMQQQSASREEMKEYNALAKKYNDMDQSHMIINKKEVMRLKIIYGKMSEKQRADAEPFPNFPPPPPAPDATKPPKAPSAVTKVKGTQPNLPPAPPVPPTPPTPMEHIKEMAAKGATFQYNGKEISAKEAIKVLQNNRKINIDSRESDGEHPVVKLSTEPIVIEN